MALLFRLLWVTGPVDIGFGCGRTPKKYMSVSTTADIGLLDKWICLGSKEWQSIAKPMPVNDYHDLPVLFLA